MATEVRHLVTAEEFIALRDDSCRMELVDGEIVRMAPSGGGHGKVTFRAAGLLNNYLEAHPIGEGFGAETGFLLRRNPDLVRAPDVSILLNEHIPPDGIPGGFIPATPDLVVEVVSPNDGAEEVQRKVQDWLNAGVPLLWLMYPGLRRVVVHAPGQPMLILGENDILDGGAVLPGFSCRVADLFARRAEPQANGSAG